MVSCYSSIICLINFVFQIRIHWQGSIFFIWEWKPTKRIHIYYTCCSFGVFDLHVSKSMNLSWMSSNHMFARIRFRFSHYVISCVEIYANCQSTGCYLKMGSSPQTSTAVGGCYSIGY